MKKYSLEVKNHALEFSVDTQNDWCRVTLVSNGISHELGADSLRIIRDRLIHGLTRQFTGEPNGEVDDAPVWCVASFMERHCTIYVGVSLEGRTLYVQNADCEWLGVVKLTPDDVKAWLARLAAMQSC